MAMPEISEKEQMLQNRLARSAFASDVGSQEGKSLQRPKWGKLLTLVGVTATVGAAVPVGYANGVMNSPAGIMQTWCNETITERYGTSLSDAGLKLLWSSIISIYMIGGTVGSVCGGWAANNFGRKGCFLISGLLNVIGAILFLFCRVASSVEMLLLGRLVVGLASGLTTTVVPMYLVELAPLALRGTFGVFTSVGVTSGVVVGQVFSLSQIFGTEDLWHYALSFFLVLVVISYLPAYFYPESPKYLYIVRGDRQRALAALTRLRGERHNQALESEIDALTIEARECASTRSTWSVLKDPTLLLPLIIVCSYQGGQQLSGINAIFNYSVSIFEAGFSKEIAEWSNLGAGVLNLIISFFTPLLMATVNRRPLMLFSTAGCAVFLFGVTLFLHFINDVHGFAYVCVLCVLLYIAFYQIGLGPIPYFVGSELFEVDSRSVAMSMGSIASWLCNFVVGICFPLLDQVWGAFVFLPFGIVCVLLFLLTKFYLPESRGRDSSELAPLVANGFRSKVK